MPKSATAKSRTATAGPPPPGVRPNLEECVRRGTRGRDLAGVDEAADRYSGDLAAELAAVEGGTHPLQERAALRQRAER
jgi:hypothetical protein